MLQKPHLVSGVTLTRCSLRRLSSEGFRHLVRTNADLSWQLHQLHSRQIYGNVAHSAQLGCCSARQRLEQLLWRLLLVLEPHSLQQEVKLELPLKRHEVAALIAVTPAYISRVFNELEKDSVLRRQGGWVIIPDPQRLWHWEE